MKVINLTEKSNIWSIKKLMNMFNFSSAARTVRKNKKAVKETARREKQTELKAQYDDAMAHSVSPAEFKNLIREANIGIAKYIMAGAKPEFRD